MKQCNWFPLSNHSSFSWLYTTSLAILLEWVIWHSLWCASIWYFWMYCMHVCMEAREPGILITHGFFNRWYFTGSISSPGSGFIGLIGASSGKSAGGFCGEWSCLTRSKVEGVMEKNRRGKYLSLHLSVSLSLSLTGPLCFLLMNSLVSVLKRTARPFVPKGSH